MFDSYSNSIIRRIFFHFIVLSSNSQFLKFMQNTNLFDGFPKLLSIGIAPRGIIAIGLVPMGVVAIGGVSMGIVTVGVVGMGIINLCIVGMGLIIAGVKIMGIS